MNNFVSGFLEGRRAYIRREKGECEIVSIQFAIVKTAIYRMSHADVDLGLLRTDAQ